MINLEISITLAVMLAAFFLVLYLLQRSGARDRQVKRDKETLRLAKSLRCDTRDPVNQRLMGLQPFYIKSEKADAIKAESRAVVISGLLIFLVFLAWAGYLIYLSYIEPAALTFAFSLGCILLLVYAKRKIVAGKDAVEQLRIELQSYESALITVGKRLARGKVGTVVDRLDFSELAAAFSNHPVVPQDSAIKRHFISKALADVTAELAPRPADATLRRHYDSLVYASLGRYMDSIQPAQLAEKIVSVTAAATVQPVLSSAPEICRLPQDSTLRRHVVTMLRQQIASDIGERPTDASLKRHYDARVEAELATCLASFEEDDSLAVDLPDSGCRGAPVKIAENSVTAVAEEKEHIPEDATLRRHLFTQLRMAIEAKLPPKPTDFNLLRHYRARVERLLERELEEHFYY